MQRRDSDDGVSAKKARVVWSVEMHQQFVQAVNQLGIDSTSRSSPAVAVVPCGSCVTFPSNEGSIVSPGFIAACGFPCRGGSKTDIGSDECGWVDEGECCQPLAGTTPVHLFSSFC